jgi:hypothetical protein
MGRGALIASALTIGGVVGVSGTVALRDARVRLEPVPELRINRQDLADLKVSAPSPGPGPEKPPAPPPTVAIDPALVEKIGELSRAVAELTRAMPKEVNLVSIQQNLEQLVIRMQAGGGAVPDSGRVLKELEEIKALLGSINGALLSREAQPLLVAVRADLKSVVDSLKSIDSSVQDLGLRQNPRSPSEGGAR